MSSDRRTGIVFDDRMTEHACIWDPDHVEKPTRYSFPLKKCEEYGLIDRCKVIPSRQATEEELLLVHSKKYIEEIKHSRTLQDDNFEAFASKYDSVYFNSKTYDCALLAAGSTLQLVSSVLNDDVKNGMAIVRPPGHHAMESEACGFCYFNNVAIAAKYALKNYNLSRILIVDWDVHHGQATQRVFYDDCRVMYFSIHRYQNGAFWPHLRESNFDFVGEGCAKGYNINVPLNGNGQGNAEYLAIFNNVLLPIAYEFCPELILISAGYDAALGCCEGEMKVTPQAYPHFINSLSCLANGRICAILEGGYCISSLSESVALTVRSLLGDPCPLIGPCIGVNQITVDSVLNVLAVQRSYWDSVKLQEVYESDTEFIDDKHFVHIEYTGYPFEGVLEYPTRDYNPVMLPHVAYMLEAEIKDLITKTDLSVPILKTCFIVNITPEHLFSQISEQCLDALKALYENGIFNDCTLLELNDDIKTDMSEFFNSKETKKVKSAWKLSHETRMCLEQKYSLNLCEDTNYDFLHLVDAIASRRCVNGFSLCYSDKNIPVSNCDKVNKFSDIPLAACYLMEHHFMKRILILDWSADHNNIQKVFYKDDKVLCISLHYCGKKDCPVLMQEVGSDNGKGYNVNIPFNHAVTDGDYLSALFHIILPIAYEFCPEFILISSVFNNECISQLSQCYQSMVHILSALCNGKMVVTIEGWEHLNLLNNIKSITSALHGNGFIGSGPDVLKPSPKSIETIQKVAKIQRKYWSCLQFNKTLPSKIPTPDIASEKRDSKPRQSSEPVAIPRRLDEPGPSTMDDWMGAAAGFDSNVELFCVTPLEYCPHLELLQPIPSEGLNPFSRCYACNDPNENWVCLHCYQVYCGRFINQHMVQHGQDMQHFLTLSYSDLSVWCYACDSYIHNQLLVPIKEHAHFKKFGEV